MRNFTMAFLGIFLLLAPAVTAQGPVENLTTRLVATWRAEGFVIPNHPLGISVITLAGNGSFRAQLGPVGTGTVSGHTASGSWRLRDDLLSFVVMQIDNTSVPPVLSQPILFQIDLLTDGEVRCRDQRLGRSMRFVRL